MNAGRASRTAEYMALFRALETTRPDDERLVHDPFAAAFLSPGLRLVAEISRLRPIGNRIRAYIDRRWPGARTSAVARTRFIDDVIDDALRSGIDQVVVLGAGFDSRAYRIPELTRATVVFEVDHPATSTAKQRAVSSALGVLPPHVRFVPVDFDSQSVALVMAGAGYDPGRPTLFVWEGVTNYLTEAAVDATLRWCASAAGGSTVIFTYVHQGVLDAPETFHGTQTLFETLRAAGESWTFGLDPAQLAGFLAKRGLAFREDVGATDYRAALYGDAAREMTGYEFYRIAVASVPRRPTGPSEAPRERDTSPRPRRSPEE